VGDRLNDKSVTSGLRSATCLTYHLSVRPPTSCNLFLPYPVLPPSCLVHPPWVMLYPLFVTHYRLLALPSLWVLPTCYLPAVLPLPSFTTCLPCPCPLGSYPPSLCATYSCATHNLTFLPLPSTPPVVDSLPPYTYLGGPCMPNLALPSVSYTLPGLPPSACLLPTLRGPSFYTIPASESLWEV